MVRVPARSPGGFSRESSGYAPSVALRAGPHLHVTRDSDLEGDGNVDLSGSARAAWMGSLVACLIVWAIVAVAVYELLR